jgi:hypothetical protein
VVADFQNTALSVFLVFCARVVYPTYVTAPRLWEMSALEDQAAAGAMMWVRLLAFAPVGGVNHHQRVWSASPSRAAFQCAGSASGHQRRTVFSFEEALHQAISYPAADLTVEPSATSLHATCRAGVDIDALAAQLQDEGARTFVKSWHELMTVIASKSAALEKAS